MVALLAHHRLTMCAIWRKARSTSAVHCAAITRSLTKPVAEGGSPPGSALVMAIDTAAARVENASAHLGYGLNTSMPRGEVDSIQRRWTGTATVGTGDVPKDQLLRDEVLLDYYTQ